MTYEYNSPTHAAIRTLARTNAIDVNEYGDAYVNARTRADVLALADELAEAHAPAGWAEHLRTARTRNDDADATLADARASAHTNGDGRNEWRLWQNEAHLRNSARYHADRARTLRRRARDNDA